MHKINVLNEWMKKGRMSGWVQKMLNVRAKAFFLKYKLFGNSETQGS